MLLLCVASSEELRLYESNDSIQKVQIEENHNTQRSKANAQVSKNFSLKFDAFANEGYSEAELEMGHAQLNEIDAPMSRYGAGLELNYAIGDNARIKLEVFASNTLEFNRQRQGGKVKAYDNGIMYDEHTYNYGNTAIYPAFVNSMGVILTFFKTHRIILTLKQTQLSSNDVLAIVPNAQIGGQLLREIITSNIVSANPWTITTQVFLTYSYVF